MCTDTHTQKAAKDTSYKIQDTQTASR